MTIDPEMAAGKRIRGDGQSYDFCSPGCQTQFDTGVTTPHAHVAEQDAHTHTEVERWTGRDDAEAAQAYAYRTMMAKFWFAALMGLPVLFTMFMGMLKRHYQYGLEIVFDAWADVNAAIGRAQIWVSWVP